MSRSLSLSLSLSLSHAKEYEEQKKDTLDELKDFEATLETMKKDNVTLVAEVDKVQLEMQAAIRNTFKAEIRDSFKKGEPEAIRTKMAAVDRDHKLGKLSDTAKAVAMAEMAGALKSMGEELTDKELKYLAAQESSKAAFEDAGSGHGGADVLDAAAKSVAKESKA